MSDVGGQPSAGVKAQLRRLKEREDELIMGLHFAAGTPLGLAHFERMLSASRSDASWPAGEEQ